MRALLFLGSGLGLGAGAGAAAVAVVFLACGKLWWDGGGDGRACGGGGGSWAGARGEEERVIVSGAAFAAGLGCTAVSGFAVGGGVVGFLYCSGCLLRMKPPSVRS